MDSLADLTVIVGHYGSGKTNLSINLAIEWAKKRKVALADLDIVNPYFRTADFKELAEVHGIELIIPPFANTNLDAPIVSPRVGGAIEKEAHLIIDVGGDDAGAFALGRYAQRIALRPYSMIYVFNIYRPETDTPEKGAKLLLDIETVSRLKGTHLFNNSNLGQETKLEDIQRSKAYGEKLAEITGRPLVGTGVRRGLDASGSGLTAPYPLDIRVVAPWQVGGE